METTVLGAKPQPRPPTVAEQWRNASVFVLSHVAVLGAFWSGVTWQAVVLCFSLLLVRQWAVTAGYHR
ncbi:MAG: hypothetical protein JRF54_11505, partial [Deltaproteobacteria bacterium]|nr:hypothetical protein [Deltaproteobacteria bacterium]MBW2404414.1 hypothetical protein [Deltaproteobacteria bacterium]